MTTTNESKVQKLLHILWDKGYIASIYHHVSENRCGHTSHGYEVGEIDGNEPDDFRGVSWSKISELKIAETDDGRGNITDILFGEWIVFEMYSGTYDANGKLNLEHWEIDEDELDLLILKAKELPSFVSTNI